MRRAAAVAGAIVVAIVIVAVTGSRSHRAPPKTAPPSTASRSHRAPPKTAPPSTASREQFGASVNLLFNGGRVSRADIDAELRMLYSTGATIARSDAAWEAAEPAPPVGGRHRYDWSFDDQIAGSLAAHRVRWLPIIDYSPPWARSIPGQDHSPPNSDAAYAAYAAAVAARYGPGGTFWREHPALPALPVGQLEIWNEPDSAVFWQPAPDPGRYARLYLAARQAIHAADPTAIVLVGGLSDPVHFLPAMVAADPAVRGRIDAVAIHPYAVTPLAVLARIVQTRRALDALGLASVALYVTEFGWTTSPRGALDWAPPRLRPGYIEGTLEALPRVGCGVAAAILYTWFSPARNPADSQQWFGISGSAGDVTAFTDGLRAAQDLRPAPGCA